MTFGLRSIYEAGWSPAVSSYDPGRCSSNDSDAYATHWDGNMLAAIGSFRPSVHRVARLTSFIEPAKDTGAPCTSSEQCVTEKHGTAESVQCVKQLDGNSRCECMKGYSTVGGVCMPQSCAGGAQELEDRIDNLAKQAAALRARSGDAAEGAGGEDDIVPTPISAERRAELNQVESSMEKRIKQEATFEELREQLDGDAETLAETASSAIEFQPSLRSLLREMGPARLENAVQDMTRGVHSVLKADKALQQGSLAMLTTSDIKSLDGTDTAIDKALVPLVQLRKVLKSIKGNAGLLRGRVEDWADTQFDEPQDNPYRDGVLPSEENPIVPTAHQDLSKKLSQDVNTAKELSAQSREAQAASDQNPAVASTGADQGAAGPSQVQEPTANGGQSQPQAGAPQNAASKVQQQVMPSSDVVLALTSARRPKGKVLSPRSTRHQVASRFL